MGRTSEEQKADVVYYATKKDISHIGHFCNTRAEVDAVAECMIIIEMNIHRYDHAVAFSPKDAARTAKALKRQLLYTQNQQHSDILKEWEAVSPWYSDVKIIKDEILDECKDILKDADIGIKRIDKIIPLLTWHLQHDVELLPEINEELVDLIKSF